MENRENEAVQSRGADLFADRLIAEIDQDHAEKQFDPLLEFMLKTSDACARLLAEWQPDVMPASFHEGRLLTFRMTPDLFLDFACGRKRLTQVPADASICSLRLDKTAIEFTLTSTSFPVVADGGQIPLRDHHTAGPEPTSPAKFREFF